MMKTVTLTWHQTNFNDLSNHDDYYFYAFTRFGKLLYIGESISQDVKDRIKQHIRTKFNHETTGLSIWLGEISHTSYERINKSLVKDVENLLIMSGQPQLNILLKNHYNGRTNLQVTCKNFPFVHKRITSK